MSKPLLNLIGNQYGKFTVIEKAEKNHLNLTCWLCRCTCGHTQILTTIRLRSGGNILCGKCDRVEKPLPAPKKIPNLTGQVFGKLTVLEMLEADKNGNKPYLCRCECGKTYIALGFSLKQGNATQCRDCKMAQQRKKRLVDIQGQKFNKLTVKEFVGYNTHKNASWLCLCDCGNTSIVTSNSLRAGKTKQCMDCRNKATGKRLNIDITGQVFGKLQAIRIVDTIGCGKLWLCKCECGNHTTAQGRYLRVGIVKSCGCLKNRPRNQASLAVYLI